MRALIARLLTGWGTPPAGTANPVADGLDVALRERRANRRPPRGEHKRFERARPKVEQLRREYAMQMVDF